MVKHVRKFYQALNKIVFKKITINFFSLILKSIFSLFLFRTITENVSPTTYAPYGAALVFIGLFTTIGSIGFGPTLIRTNNLTNSKINTYLSLSFILGMLLASILYFFADKIENILGIEGSKLYFQLVSPIIVIKLVSMIYEAIAQRELKIQAITSIDFFSFFIFHFICQIIVLKLQVGLVWLVVCIIFEEVFRLIFYKKISTIKFYFILNITEIKNELSFSGILTINRVINYFNSQIDKMFVSSKLSPTDFSGYSRVFQLVNYPINIIGQLFDKIFYPMICRKLRTSKNQFSLNTIGFVFIFGLLGTLFCYLIGGYVELYFFNGEWKEYMELYYILIFLIPIKLIDRYSSVIINAYGKPIIRTYSQIFFIVSLIIGLYFNHSNLNYIAKISIIAYGISALTSILYLVFKHEK
ncbi:oligosaccharide flippase family protein [Providencia rettgeri]|uniref:oligosaccharide flippase family protein n=1 Tax=Providencia rettgeri TaxID=587 RepID=UPI00235EB09A|nr:oligosaccharide flippase family protein [Providencia rettgeri]